MMAVQVGKINLTEACAYSPSIQNDNCLSRLALFFHGDTCPGNLYSLIKHNCGGNAPFWGVRTRDIQTDKTSQRKWAAEINATYPECSMGLGYVWVMFPMEKAG